MSEGRKTVTLNLGQAGGSPAQATGSTKLKAQQGPLSKEFLKGFAKLLKMHTVRDKFDIALAVSRKKEPGKVGPRYMSSSRESFFGDLTEEWVHLTERNRVKWKKSRKQKEIEEYGSQGRTAAQGGISDAGHSPPTLGFPSG